MEVGCEVSHMLKLCPVCYAVFPCGLQIKMYNSQLHSQHHARLDAAVLPVMVIAN